MSKELPKMYRNNIDKEINNSQSVYSSMYNIDNKPRKEENLSRLDKEFLINQKINNIFNATDYIYKADVTIVTENGSVQKRIVGKNRDNLITMDNEYIPISSIIDIYK